MSRTSHDVENYVGIRRYSSRSPGFEAIFKDNPEDFRVVEITNKPKKDEGGSYTAVWVRLRNWDTNNFVLKLAKELRINHNRITYAGTKDKFAVSEQYFCIEANIESFPDIKDCTFSDPVKTASPLHLGDLMGNEFSVQLRSETDRTRKIQKIYSEIVDRGGFPNFYGLQRFGTQRPITHMVGKHLVLGDYEGAVNEYLCDPSLDSDEFRLDYDRNKDVRSALKEFPPGLTFERLLLGHMARNGNAKEAFRMFPRNLAILFVHAYQSYIFNIALSRRIEMVDNLNEIMIGDHVVPVDQYFNPQMESPFQCDKFNFEKLNKLSKENKVRAVIKLPGFATEFTNGPMDTILREILMEEKIDTEKFRIGGNRSLSSKGSYRIVSVIPLEFNIEKGMLLKFTLGKGIYATVFLREFLKDQVLA